MKKIKNETIEKKLKIRLYLTLLAYAVTGPFIFVLFLFFQNPISEWLDKRMDIVYGIYLLVGILAIFRYYWKKPWDYLNEIIAATQIVYEQNDRTIELSEPLRKQENQMNQIKMSVLINQNAAKEAEEKKDELVMYLAHDIRTPLTTVLGYLSLVDEAPEMPDEKKSKYIKIALEKVERLEKLINELFEITRYNSRRIAINKKKVYMYFLLIQVIEEFYPILSEKNIQIKLKAEENLTCNIDSEKMARAFGNLLKNAVAYSYPNTTIKIIAKKQGNNIIVVFQNHGPTIPADQLTAIFEKFTRLDGARLSDTGGSGLGLSIAKEIVLLHNGKITAESDNNNILITIVLPI